MASIRRRGTSWRAELSKDGKRESCTFPTKREAVAWAQAREAELIGKALPDRTVHDALEEYCRTVTPTHKGAKWEETRINLMQRSALASVRLPAIEAADIAAWKEWRLESVSGASVRREMTILKLVFDHARDELGWLRVNPMQGVKRPAKPRDRKRRVTQDEIDRVTLALGYDGGAPQTASDYTALAWHFAIETAMRSGEILGLTWDKVLPRKVILPDTKNGDKREVPLSTRAREIIALLPTKRAVPFYVKSATRDKIFRDAVKRTGIPDLHFHDSRSEAIWRLSKKLPVLDLARAIGHRDIKSLMIYYETDADDLSAMLD